MNRKRQLLETLSHLTSLPERPPIVVVDNGSTDGTPQAVGAAFPSVDLVCLGRNIGAAARTVGVERLTTPYVAFSDDDSWWAPGGLQRAADVLDSTPRLAVVAARVLVGDDERVDPVTLAMEASPLAKEDLPGPAVLGFLACGVVLRRDAYLEVGGFDDLLFLFGEERLLAVDLARAGWRLAYRHDVIAHHHPATRGRDSGKRRLAVRNRLLLSLMRRPLPTLTRDFTETLRLARRDPLSRRALLDALVRAPSAILRRQVLPPSVERRLRLVDDGS